MSPATSTVMPDSPRIHVRRFAGPAAYAEQIAHLRVAHLTDLHVGAVTPMRVQRAAVALTNAERPDLVLITGDFVCHGTRYLDELASVIAGFEAPVVAVLGNHDHWSGAAAVRRALERAGAGVLVNRHTSITLRGQTIQIVGLDDAFTGHASLDEAVRDLRPNVPTIGLSHIAEEADGLWARGVPLVLSGHTHAGQVNAWRMADLMVGAIGGHRYIHGLYGTRARGAEPGGAVYVGAGIGAAVIPVRWGERAQREIAIFELGAHAGTFDEHHAEQAAPSPRRRPLSTGELRRALRGYLQGTRR
jgi:hypothetical protein